jgi:hypothetical protein
VPFLRKNDRANNREKLALGLGVEEGKNPKIWLLTAYALIVAPNHMALQARNNIGAMDTHWKPGEYEGQAESLKDAVKSLRKDASQQQPEKRTPAVSSRSKGKPQRKRKG